MGKAFHSAVCGCALGEENICHLSGLNRSQTSELESVLGGKAEAFPAVFLLNCFLELQGGLSCLFLKNPRCHPWVPEQLWDSVPCLRLCWNQTSEPGAPL